jgi:isoaspartyl peptidase/L-asparaginase-like protein (Ntn-hydrolase superfamily)
MKRREVFKSGIGFGVFGGSMLSSCTKKFNTNYAPVVISTWDHGMMANTVAWEIIANGGSALDAAEKGVKVVESDPNVRTVGLGGFPDRQGVVTLDACIMDGMSGKCGSVAFLKDIENPISVARLIMDQTPHAMLVGQGALDFALSKGFVRKDLLTDASKTDYENWLQTSQYQPTINIENHDTIGLLCLDEKGNVAGACTTSGAAYKMHGRVGDSPLIGAGLFVDNEVGAACATGLGEAVIRSAGSAMIVEAMRNGSEPLEACRQILNRIVKKEDIDNLQVGFLALRKDGSFAGLSIRQGFTYAINTEVSSSLLEAPSILS